MGEGNEGYTVKKVIFLIITMLIIGAVTAIPASAGSTLIEQGDALLQQSPPDYEKAAQLFRRAGLQGDGEGYYRLGQMYEEGLLTVGNACTEDISALGREKAEEYYQMAAQNGYTADTAPGWKAITQDEAKEMMARDDGHILVDVRRQDEYDAGHIPGAILIPNESISDTQPEELPDFNQILLIYCRSGNRSKQAAQKLADIGYTNVYEFGGINTWDGEIETKAAAPVTASAEWDMSVPTEITEKVQKLFDDATAELDGVEYTPVAVLGMRDNTCCILCKATAVYPDAKPYNVLVYVNEDGIQNIYELWIEKHAEKETP